MIHNELCNELENLVDRHTLGRVLTHLSYVCDMKAEHLLIQWQDKMKATQWELAAAVLDEITENEAIEAVS